MATRGVVRSPALAALIQSDSDRHIKMQILACALLAIFVTSFLLVWHVEEKRIRALAPGLNIQMAT